MIDKVIEGKKILVFGGIGPMTDLITLAHRNHVKVGVADYNKDTHMKKIADYVHDINILDIDEVVKLYKDNHYDGIITNFNDMLMPYAAEIASRVGAYVPYDKEQIKMSTDKRFFKNKCLEYGVNVPKEYSICAEEDIQNVGDIFPVIVKPVDGSGSKGISICRDKNELLSGYRKAKETSKCGEIIVEEYIEYDDEVNLTYIIINGKAQLAAVHDRYFNHSQKNVMRVPDIYIYPSKYTNIIMDSMNKTIVHMLEGIGLQNGSLFLQGCVKDNVVYLYEAGMRLNGCKTYQILEYENKFNTFEHLLNYALTGHFCDGHDFNPLFKKWYATWNVVAKPGATIEKIVGAEEIASYPWMIHNGMAYFPGDTIPQTAAGTLIQLQSRIHLSGDTKEELFEHLEKTFTLYHVYDKNGQDVLLPPHSIMDLHKKLDYTLS